MQMPVVVGIIVAIIVLVSFTGWFYNLVKGWEEFVLDDVYFWYRIGAASVFSITIMTLTFFGMAYLYECPDKVSADNGETGSALSKKLNCPTFNRIKISAEELFAKKTEEEPVEAPEEIDLESQTEEI